jgi:hypothetical protein
VKRWDEKSLAHYEHQLNVIAHNRKDMEELKNLE